MGNNKPRGYSSIHRWLDYYFGTPRVCDNPFGDCRAKKGCWYDWAVVKGKKYEKERGNFMRLCRSCHRRYDLTEDKKQEAVKNLWWKKGGKNPGKPNVQNLWWQKDMIKTRELKLNSKKK